MVRLNQLTDSPACLFTAEETKMRVRVVFPTSADPLFFSGQNPRRVDHADALQHGVRKLRTHKPATEERQK